MRRKFLVGGGLALALLAGGIPAVALAAQPASAFQRPPGAEGDHPGLNGDFTNLGHPAPVMPALGSPPTQDLQLTAPLTAAPQCTLTVPADPLSARGLATPYRLGSTAGTQCSEADAGTAAFVQATIYNVLTGQLSVYDPEVTDAGTTPAVTPPVPQLSFGDVVSIWVGFNDNVLKLLGPGAGSFINFAQQSYAGNAAFYAALNAGIRSGKVTVPAPGTSPADNMTCPTTHDFSIVDQDPSDNVPVTYAYDQNISNGSDEQLLDLVGTALGCQEWKVTTLDPAISGPGPVTSGALQEVQATLYQAPPVADVPGDDEFVTSDGNFVAPAGNGVPDLALDNLYRAQVDQPFTLNDQDTPAWCRQLSAVGAARLAADANTESGFPAPSFAQIGENLALVLANRFVSTWTLLNCTGQTALPDPVTVVLNGAGVATSATYASSGLTITGTPPATPSMTPAPAAS
jgi:hypothetical protein